MISTFLFSQKLIIIIIIFITKINIIKIHNKIKRKLAEIGEALNLALAKT